MNTTTAQDHVFWQSESGVRGTWSIVISCFSTLAISLWSALHLSVPSKRETWKQNLARKLGWTACGLLLPELLTSIAADQLAIAHSIRNEVNARFEPVSPPEPWYHRWFRKHPSPSLDERDEERTLVGDRSDSSEGSSVPQDMNSKSIESSSSSDGKKLMKQVLSLPDHKPSPTGRHRWTLAHGFYAGMGGFAFYDNNRDLRIITSGGMREIIKTSPDLIPNISIETIQNTSKADGLAKTLLVLQLGWFCISSVGRLAQHLPLTLLEVSTLTHALCAVVIYVLWWHKPLNIAEPLIISDSGTLMNDRQWDRKDDTLDEGWPGANDYIAAPVVLFLIIPLVYGAPHLAAWNSNFATNTERLLWRISACAVTGLPFLGTAMGVLNEALKEHQFKFVAKLFSYGLVSILILSYFFANLFLIAESLRQLFHLPPAAFQTTKWAELFPHI